MLIPYTSALTRRNSFAPFASEFFRDFFEPVSPACFKVDVRDDGDRFLMEAELPGVKKDGVKVSIENGVLTITAAMNAENEEKKGNYIYRERRVGSMQRAFSLEGVQEDSITGEYVDGVLKLSLPKRTEPLPAKREIEIN